jgi:DNA polymerase-1
MKYLKKSYPHTTLLIDGDLYLYRVLSACETETDWGDDIWSLSTDLKEAKKAFKEMMEFFKLKLRAEEIVITFSGHNNFRKSVEPTYKASRKKTRKPIGYREMIDWVKENYQVIQIDNLEADDVMGIMGSVEGTKSIVVSDDKDMKSVPCRLYRPQTDERHDISLQDADRQFFTQTLTGDVTDGYAGCPKIGPKTAEKVLGMSPNWRLVVNAYQKEKLDFNYALTQARLARILRSTDWDDEKGEVKLWEPTA